MCAQEGGGALGGGGGSSSVWWMHQLLCWAGLDECAGAMDGLALEVVAQCHAAIGLRGRCYLFMDAEGTRREIVGPNQTVIRSHTVVGMRVKEPAVGSGI